MSRKTSCGVNFSNTSNASAPLCKTADIVSSGQNLPIMASRVSQQYGSSSMIIVLIISLEFNTKIYPCAGRGSRYIGEIFDIEYYVFIQSVDQLQSLFCDLDSH